MLTVVPDPAALRWVARRGDERLGELRALVRPDGRCYVRLRDCAPGAHAPLVAAAEDALRRDLHINVDEADTALQERLREAGFGATGHEHRYRLPADRRRHRPSRLPAQDYRIVTAEEVPFEQLRGLDEALRQDVPGTDGWRTDPDAFREELDAPEYDPTTYPVAVHEPDRGSVGLARIWWNPAGPRLGLIGVLPAHRRRGLAAALLARALAVVHERGESWVSTEVDATNTASNALCAAFGAERTGGAVHLLRAAAVTSSTVPAPQGPSASQQGPFAL